jgi:tetratricopeptide (TPR) repeat protein
VVNFYKEPLVKRTSSLSLILITLFILIACDGKEAQSLDAVTRSPVQAAAAAADGKCADAKDLLGPASEKDKDLIAPLLSIARCFDKKDQGAQSYEFYRRALDSGATLDSKDRIEALEKAGRFAFLNNDPAKAEAFAKEAEALGDASINISLLRAALLVRNNDFNSAVPLLEKILLSDADNEEASVGLASAYSGKGDLAKAKDLLASFLEKKPASTQALSLFLTLARQTEDLEAGVNCLQKLIALSPDNNGPILSLSEFYLAANKNDAAVQTLRSFLEKKPDDLTVRLHLAGILTGQMQFDKSLEVLDQAPRQSGEIKLARSGTFMRAGRMDDAVNVLKSIVDDPRDKTQAPEARLGLAELYAQMGMPKDAENQISALIASNPERVEAYALRGRIRLGARNFNGAIEDFSALLKARPNDYQTAISLAETYNAAGNSTAAETEISRVLAKAPQFGPAYIALANFYLARNMPDAALLTLNIGRDSAPDDISIPMFASALLANLKRYDESIKILDPLSSNTDPQVAETALLRLAAIYSAQNNSAKVLAAYDRTLKLNPASTMAAEGRIRFQIGAKQEKAALAFAEKRQKERPADPAAANMTGECALANKDVKKAENAYRRALDLAPDWEQPLLMLIRIYTGTQRMDQAIKLCRDLAEKYPNNVNPEMYYGMLLEQTGKFTLAEEQYRKILTKKPDYLAAANNLAFLITRHKPEATRLAEAEELARKAAAGDAAQPLDTLGWVQHLRGDNAAAEVTLRKSLERQDKNAFTRYHLAAVLAAFPDKDKKSEAQSLLKALTAEKNFPLRADAEKLLKTLGGDSGTKGKGGKK